MRYDVQLFQSLSVTLSQTLCIPPLNFQFRAAPGSANAEALAEEEMKNKLFIAVGTAIIDKDGEDVSSKGRVLLFEVHRSKERAASVPVAELNFAHEKKTFHGPVTTLSCLSNESKNWMVVGAGADVNVEQWGVISMQHTRCVPH